MINETTYYYLYSSLLQSQAAILSLLGVFIVLKIQNLKQEIEYCKSAINNVQAVNNFGKKTQEEKIKYLEDDKIRCSRQNANTTHIDMYQKLIENDKEIGTIKKEAKVIMYKLVVGMGIDCIGILFSITLFKIVWLGLLFAFMAIVFFLLSLKNVVESSIKMI